MYKNKSVIGKKFSRWTVLKFSDSYKKRYPRLDCVCDCGSLRSVLTHSITKGISKSCGCLKKEIDKIKSLKHSMHKTKEYSAWVAMKSRCNNSKWLYFNDYGGRGIKVCSQWEKSFINFFNDMGKKPSARHSLDRIDVNGNYEPSNCRWATQSEQNRNRRQIIGKIKGIKALKSGVFEVTISAFGKTKYIGRFKDIELAKSAYKSKQREMGFIK